MVVKNKSRENLIQERTVFENWLVKKKHVSKKMSRDISSRVNRVKCDIENEIEINLANEDLYCKLILKMNNFAINYCENKDSERALKRTLKYAVNLYAIYLYGNDAVVFISKSRFKRFK